MKKKIFLASGFSIVVIALSVQSCKMYYETQKVEYVASVDKTQLEEGKRLTMLMCGTCHYDPETKKLSGVHMKDVPGFVGKVIAKNITKDPVNGIGNYADAELAYLMRTGVARDGKLMPYMQKPNLADEDLKAIIAFLRSDDELVSASGSNPGKTKYTALGKFGISRSKPLGWPLATIKKPAPSDQIAFGKYLVDNLSCYDCHSKSFASINKMQPEQSKGFMGGGNKLKDRSGKTVLSSNLTPHETGIGTWGEADFLKAMRQGISKDNSIITYPMPMYSELTHDEIWAIFAYLRSLPPINNKIRTK